MDQELNFSLSYEQLTRTAEDEIKKCWLNPDGAVYLKELGRASAILGFWRNLAISGGSGKEHEDRVNADSERLAALVYKE
ncbi:hypothetical protein [Pluralibacter sp.]|uniref:hypothetical protein n=1 Tax=Pluralibacter sp. TaxID=1920032 RepID=UPI0025CE3765|nr:hypothetical protein [Pluralibacter sp.]MBV8042575.1 hypothetical protein [Pluralibacter sp.]